eukprot:TRINITY_DN759_c0_g1_i10.p1 TRINITY_DN759_c0_g1~~TRINITY_DN759_c0_g1_i10.p1  ORF type:complete len:453 (+),score=147.25 TRINITY_DN759_c0_g1_i10:159-1361(+)
MAAHRPAARAIGSDGPPPPAPAVGDVSRSVRLPKGRVFVVPRGAEGGYGDRSTTVAEAVAAAASGAPDGGECMTVARAGGGGGGGGGGATAVRLVGPAATGAPTARWPAAANRQTAVSGSLGHGTRVTKVPSITSAAAAAIHAMARIASTRSVSMHGGVCGGGGGEGGAGTDGTGGAGGAGASPTPVTDGPSGGGTTDGGGSGTPEESSDTDDSECFPAAATVQLEGGGVTTMDRLSVGDRVRTASGSYSDVFLFTHAEATGDHTYIRLSTAAGALTATRGHYVLVNGGVRTAAAAVVVGDVLSHLPAGVCGGASEAIVTGVATVTRAGLFNPQTLDGTIVVDGFAASTYTTAVEPVLAAAALAPLRAAYAWLGWSAGGLSRGGPRALVAALPKGASVAA